LVAAIRNSLSTDATIHDGVKHAWESQNFEHLPLIAVITNLTQMQTAVRNVEGDFISYILGSIDAGSFKFNKLAPIVIPNSTYIMQGSEYNAQIFLGAFDTTQAPYVQINGRQVEVDPKTNMAVYKVRGSGLGTQKYQGVIKIKKPNSDDTLTYPFTQEYQVAQSSVVVSPSKMNVFYVGVDNPVEISVPGIPGNDVNATMSGGSIAKSGSSYVVRCSKPGKAMVNVSAKIDGSTKSMGSKEFRIKPVPDPVATVWDMEGGQISAAQLAAAKQVDAKMKNFDFDLKFVVTSYTASTKSGDYVIDESVQGNRITSSVKGKILSKLKKGQKVYFEDITAIGPDKKPRKLGIIMFKVN
jgi:gliding motility-associated protein GldM